MFATQKKQALSATERTIAASKRFLSVTPPGLKNRSEFAKWFWLRSPAAKAAYPVIGPLLFGCGALFWVGGNTLFGHTDVWFNKEKTHFGWDIERTPERGVSKKFLNSETYRQNYRARHERHETQILMDHGEAKHQAPYDFVTFRAGIERVPDDDVEL